MKDKKIYIPIIIIFIGLILYIGSQVLVVGEKDNDKKKDNDTNIIVGNENYNSNVIKASYNKNNKNNYLISPYSIEIALNLLKEGSNNNTKDEIEKAIPNRSIPIFNSQNIKVSNGAFIKNEYKNFVEKDFVNNLTNKYNSEIIYDDFTTPDKINNWVNEKTDGMIKKILNDMSKDFVYGVINAVALDFKFENQFECEKTKSGEFTKADGTKINVEMMHETYSYKINYVINDDYKAISLPYRSEENNKYELVAILPSDLDKFINNLDDDKLDNIMKDSKVAGKDNVELSLYLPRFRYEYKLEDKDFVDVLNTLGIKDAFDKEKGDFTKVITQDNLNKLNIRNLYVAKAIHKTYIDLNEEGTKAAAVTYFGVDKANAVREVEIKEIKFDKPFVYMIREVNTNEILFFGIVYEPNEWKGTTCSN